MKTYVFKAGIVLSLLIGSFSVYADAPQFPQNEVQPVKNIANQLQKEILQSYGKGGIMRFKSAKSREQLISILKGMSLSPTAQMLSNTKWENPNFEMSLGYTTVDPCDLGCLNCIGAHCPVCKKK